MLGDRVPHACVVYLCAVKVIKHCQGKQPVFTTRVALRHAQDTAPADGELGGNDLLLPEIIMRIHQLQGSHSRRK